MTKSENPGYPEPAKGDTTTPLQIRREALYSAEEAIPPSISTIAVVRPPFDIAHPDMSAFYTRLLNAGILPIASPPTTREDTYEDPRYFPTDQYREVGGRILVVDHLRMDNLLTTLDAHKDTRPFTFDIRTRERPAGTSFAGGKYVYDEHSKILIYDNADLRSYNDPVSLKAIAVTDDALEHLHEDEWNVIPLDFDDEELTFDERRKDFDFVVSSPFKGKDKNTYMFVAEPLLSRFENDEALRQTGIHFLPVPVGEMLKGGCNVADLNRSRVLACANRDDAPTVFSQLTELAEARVIETPKGFLEGGGGPRCSISSISIR